LLDKSFTLNEITIEIPPSSYIRSTNNKVVNNTGKLFFELKFGPVFIEGKELVDMDNMQRLKIMTQKMTE
jgi:hypothetical protein